MELTQGMEAADRNTRLFKGMEPAVNRLGGRQSKVKGNSKHAQDVGKLTMRRWNADSRTLNVMLVVRKATVLLLVGQNHKQRATQLSTSIERNLMAQT